MTEYQDWTVVRLKEELRSQGLSQSGKKADLIQRLLDGDAKKDSEIPSSYDQWRAEGNNPKNRIGLNHTPIEKGEWIGKKLNIKFRDGSISSGEVVELPFFDREKLLLKGIKDKALED